MVKEFVNRAGWASVVGLMCAGTTYAVFAVALILALLCEFIATGHICEIVGESAVTTGGRVCGATSLVAFVVGFGVGGWRTAREAIEADQRRVGERRGEEPLEGWRRG